MSDEISYQGKLIGSIHYFVYNEGKLPGKPNSYYVRLNNSKVLEQLLTLDNKEILLVEGEEMTVKDFKNNILTKVSHIGFLKYDQYLKIIHPPKITEIAS